MIRALLDYRISIRQLVYLGLLVGIPYGLVGLLWLSLHHDHLGDLDGLDQLFSLLGEIVAWPVLVVADVTIT